jgi:hypothetical protein
MISTRSIAPIARFHLVVWRRKKARTGHASADRAGAPPSKEQAPPLRGAAMLHSDILGNLPFMQAEKVTALQICHAKPV